MFGKDPIDELLFLALAAKVARSIGKDSEEMNEEIPEVPKHSLAVINESVREELKENRRRMALMHMRGQDITSLIEKHNEIWSGIYEEHNLNPDGEYNIDIRNGALTYNMKGDDD